ncbi:MAG: tripartite tricarboxylate transporter TctB family protein [Rhodospirillales bacterium]|nr:MAG: tripartite tricarboxylate transporter TctB family protein [Rhodospirillales bacterium]
MSRDNDDPDSADGPSFVGEEEVGEPTTPAQNLIAAVVIGAIAVLAMVMALQLQIPKYFFSAPGFLPFVVGLCLFLMALGLGVSAVRAGGASDLRNWRRMFDGYLRDIERRRTWLLLGIVIVYVVVVDLVSFEWRQRIGGFDFRFSGYELFSTLALVLILRIFWRKPIPHCLGVAFAMSMALAAVFRYGFRILLPGLG